MATPVSSTREAFSQAVRAVLETWPVLQIAVDNGFGGVHSQQKAEWMVDAVQEYFQQNDDLQQYEVEDFLAELMNNEFDTVVDDGSLPQVALKVSQMFRQCQQGQLPEVQNQIALLVQRKSTGRANAKLSKAHEDEESSEDEQAREEPMECESATATTSQEPAPPTHTEDDSDGWTVVRRKK